MRLALLALCLIACGCSTAPHEVDSYTVSIDGVEYMQRNMSNGSTTLTPTGN